MKNSEASGVGKGISGLVAAVGGQVAATATGGKMTRNPACDPFYANGGVPSRRSRGGSSAREPPPKDLKEVSKDCFIIPQENLERFLPDGITVRA